MSRSRRVKKPRWWPGAARDDAEQKLQFQKFKCKKVSERVADPLQPPEA